MRHPVPLSLLALVAFVALGPGAGCGGAPAHAPVNTSADSCDAKKPETCEAAIAGALDRGEDPAPFLRTLVAAKQAQGDPSLANLEAALDHADKHALLVRVAGAGPKDPRSFDLAEPPKLTALPLGRLMLAMGRVTKASLVVVAMPDGKVLRVYPRDPLAPLMGGLLPFAWTRDPIDFAAESALEEQMELATTAAEAFDYSSAATAIDAMDDYFGSHDGLTVPYLRAGLLSAAMGLAKPATWVESSTPSPKHGSDVAPEPQGDDTPYLDLLFIRHDPKASWQKRGERLLAAFPTDRRAAVDAVFDPKPPCGLVMPPPIKDERDLIFSGLVPRALLAAHARGTQAQNASQGRLPIDKWYDGYTSLATTVDRTSTAYLFIFPLVSERGQSAGIVPSGSDAHRIVTSLALRHARALKKLATEKPGRVGWNQLGFLIAPGNLIDADLRKEVIDLAQVSARGSLEGAHESGDAILALLGAALSGMQLPPELREAHYSGLASVFASKLEGEFAKKTGWGVAALYALDGAYRVGINASPDLSGTANQIERALETDPAIAEPALASLAAALTRYAVLARAGQLGTGLSKGADVRPERAAALAALERSLAALGDGGPADAFVRDTADLADGTIATVATVLEASNTEAAPKKPSGSGVSPKTSCANDSAPLDPRAKNALAHLRDTRRTIFANAEWKAPAGKRARRLKLVALVLSDVMDAIEDNGDHKQPFGIAGDDARKILEDALTDWIAEPGVAPTLKSGYLIARGFLEHGTHYFDGAGAGDVRDLLASLGIFFGSGNEKIEGAAILSMLLPKGASVNSDLGGALIDVARALYAAKKPQEADMALLGLIVVGALKHEAPSEDAIKLVREEKSDVGWVLSLMSAIHEVDHGHAPDVGPFESGLERAVTSQCGVASVRDIGSVLSAVGMYASGKHKEARAALEGVLDDARQKGLFVPRYSFSFKQETTNRAFQVTLDIGLAQGFVTSINSFNIGGGAKTAGEPSLAMTQSVASPDAKQSLDDSARYLIHASALLAIYDFLDGDPKEGEIVAARTLGFVTQHGWLGVAGITDEPRAWAKDSRAALAILGELAAESGRPLLAGELFAVVKETLDASDTLETIDKSLEDPFGLVGIPELKGVPEKARDVVHRLAAGLACVKKKAPMSPDRVTCAEYPLALALRVADAATVMPTLGPKAGTCPDLAALDAFLEPAEARVYDPDKFLAAADALMAAGKSYDATVLLAKHRREDHCSPAVSSLLNALADRMKGAPVARADLLTAFVNCSTGAQPAALAKALSSLDDDLIQVGDPRRTASLALFAAGAGIKIGTWEPLEAIALKPGFIERWQSTYPEAIGAALVLDHAATILHGDPVRLDATAAQYDLVCGGMPAPDRAVICKTLESLRKKGPPDDALKKTAQDALASLLGPQR